MTKQFISKINFRALTRAGCAGVALLTAPALAQEADKEARLGTVTVTGSFISGTPEGATLPVDVVSVEDLRLRGKPNITELIRNLGISSGVDGQTNQFASSGLEGTSNINLRGLGPGRSLVLLNGRRQNFAPVAISEQAQFFVDTNMIPSVAIGRIELLKDGAAALYGSDAIAGVVNFITNSELDGLEIGGSYQTFDESDGEYDISAAYGLQGNNWNWVSSIGYQFRNEVALVDKGWAIKSITENPVGGWSTIGNPGSFVALGNVGTGLAAAQTPLAFANSDDACATLGGVDGGVLCNFQFTQFGNLVEEESRYQVFSEYNRTFDNGSDLHIEALYGFSEIPSWKTSPSYPPQVLTGQIVAPDHPGFQAYTAANPAWAAATFTDYSPLLTGGAPDAYDPATGTGGLGLQPLIYFGRAFGFGGFPGTGGAQEGSRDYSTLRLAADLMGEFGDTGVSWDLGYTFQRSEADRATRDSYIVGFASALSGFGVCTDAVTGLDPATGTSPSATGYAGSLVAGQDSCEYYNPFSNAIATNAITGTVNPGYDASVANSTALANWLIDDVQDLRKTSLQVVDGVITGDTGWTVAGGEVLYAAGFQLRFETYALEPAPVADLDITPGPDGTGPFSFVAGTTSADEEQSIVALFSEFQLPLTERLDVQAALRYEDYGGNTGGTIDPKIAAKFVVTENFSLRGSAQTSFKGPTLNQLSGTETTLQFVAPTGAFKAVDRVGNTNLKPESASSFNLGAIVDTDRFNASVDFYNLSFIDPIIVESFTPIVDAAIAALASGDTTNAILGRVSFQDPTNPTAAGISRIKTNIVNGPDISTSGIDLRAEFNTNRLGAGDMTIGGELTYVLTYDVDDFTIEGVNIAGGDRVGQFNRSNSSRSLPQYKTNAFVNYAVGNHNVRGIVHYIDSYKDERPAAARGSVGETIDSHTSLDLHYNWIAPRGVDVGLSVVNVADQDPPFAAYDLNYDAYTHNPFGRTIKFSVSKKFGGGE